MIVKSLKVFALASVVVGFYSFFTYFNSLEFRVDAPLEACWDMELYDPETRARIRGVEDIAFDSKTGDVFISAYDRRRVRGQLEEGEIISRGGLYTFKIAELLGAPGGIIPRKLTRGNYGEVFLPHGIGYSRPVNREKFMAVNRNYAEGDSLEATPELIEYDWDGENIREMNIYREDWLCRPNDVAVYRNGFFVSNDRAHCGKELSPWENFWDKSGSVYRYQNGEFKVLARNLAFANGVAVVKRVGGDLLAVSLTQADQIHLYEIHTGELYKRIRVPGAPDNLTVDEDGNIYFTMFPNLPDYYFYTEGLMGVTKTPTGVYRIFAESDWNTIQLLYHDNGDMVSGATVAQPARNFLIMGSAWDDNIAVCRGLISLGGLEKFGR